MSENLRVNIWRDKFTSDYLRVNLPSNCNYAIIPYPTGPGKFHVVVLVVNINEEHQYGPFCKSEDSFSASINHS